MGSSSRCLLSREGTIRALPPDAFSLPARGHSRPNEWLIAALVLLVAFVPVAVVAFYARPTSGLVSLQIAGSNATLILLLLSQGFGRQPFVDLALIAAVMSFVGTVVLAGFVEQGVK